MEKRNVKESKPIQLLTREEKRLKTASDVSSKDLTRKELFLYIFSDFFRISYIVLCLFLDALIIGLQLFHIDDSIFHLFYFGTDYITYYYMYIVYITLLIITLEVVAINFQLRIYRKIFYKPLLNPKFR